MPQVIFNTGFPGEYIEAHQAYQYAIRTGEFEFDGYNVITPDERYREGLKRPPIWVTPVVDSEAPAEFITVSGGRYNAAEPPFTKSS